MYRILYVMIFTFFCLFVILIVLAGRGSRENDYPKHIEDRSFLDDVYARAEEWSVSADVPEAPTHIVKRTMDVPAK